MSTALEKLEGLQVIANVLIPGTSDKVDVSFRLVGVTENENPFGFPEIPLYLGECEPEEPFGYIGRCPLFLGWDGTGHPPVWTIEKIIAHQFNVQMGRFNKFGERKV